MLMPFAFCSLEHIIVYISFVLVFVCLLWTKCKELDKMDLDFRTLPMKNGVWRATRPHAFRVLKCQRATRPHAFRMLNLEDEHWKDHILNSLLSIHWLYYRTFWCVFSCARISNLSLIEEPLPWASKREKSKIPWGALSKNSLIVDCLSLCFVWLLIPKDESYLDHHYDLKRETPCVVLLLVPYLLYD
jgi:hypothetical protein